MNDLLIETGLQITYSSEMIMRVVRIGVILISFLFLTGFLPLISLLGPGYTMFSSGSIYKAGAQYFINKGIENKTGKNSLDFVKDKIEEKKHSNYINQELKKIIERRVELARKKLNLKNISQ